MNRKVTIGFIFGLLYGFVGLLFLIAAISVASLALIGALVFGLCSIPFFGMAYISVKWVGQTKEIE